MDRLEIAGETVELRELEVRPTWFDYSVTQAGKVLTRLPRSSRGREFAAKLNLSIHNFKLTDSDLEVRLKSWYALLAMRGQLCLDVSDPSFNSPDQFRALLTKGEAAEELKCRKQLLFEAPIVLLAVSIVNTALNEGHSEATIERRGDQVVVLFGTDRVEKMRVPVGLTEDLFRVIQFFATCDPRHVFRHLRGDLKLTHFEVEPQETGLVFRWA